MALNSNSNNHFIKKLALKSLKENRFRNTCILVTIIISTILMILVPVLNSSLFFIDFNNVDKQQHAIIYELSNNHITDLKQEQQLSDKVLNKTGGILEHDASYLRLSYFENCQNQMNLFNIIKGNYPQSYKEIMIDDSYAKEKNLNLNDEIIVKDSSGKKETFIIVGIVKPVTLENIIPLIYTSKEYAINGTLLKNRTYNMYIKTNPQLELSRDDNIDLTYALGDKYNINTNNIEINTMYMNSILFSPDRLYFYFFVDFALLIVGLVVIYSILYISVISRKPFFAQLNTLGMTQSQIKKFICQESLILSLIGTITGSIITGIISYFIIGKYWYFSIYLLVSIIVSLFIIATITISSMRPAKIAASISPIEATKNIDHNKNMNSKIHKICIETLAQMHFYHNIKKSTFTMISLIISGVVFFTSIAYANSVSTKTYARTGYFKDHDYIIEFINTEDYSTQNLIDMQKLHLYDETLIQRLNEIPEVKSVDKIQETQVSVNFNNDLIYSEINPFNKEEYENIKKYMHNPPTYEELVKKRGIIEPRNNMNENVYGWKFKIDDKIQINFFNGSDYTPFHATIQGFTSSEYLENNSYFVGLLIPEELIKQVYPDTDLTRFLLIDIDDQQYSKHTDKQIKNILKDYPLLNFQSWQQQQTEINRQNNIIEMLSFILSGFCIFFCIINITNTMISSMISRNKELALYESIGMETKQIKKMLIYETLYMSIPSIMLSLVIGIIIGRFFIQLINMSSRIYYQLPITWTLLYIIFMITVPIFIVLIEYRRFSKIPLTERLKEDE